MVEEIFSTEEEFAEACRASARKYNARRMHLGQMFRAAQEEAYAAWSAWDQALGAQDDELEIRAEETPVVDLITARKKKAAQQRKRVGLPYEARVSLPYAASEVQTHSPQEQLRLAPINTFEVEGARYEALADAKGHVFLRPAPESRKTHLMLGEHSYLLERVEDGQGLCRVLGLGQGQLARFFAHHRRAKADHRISFI